MELLFVIIAVLVAALPLLLHGLAERRPTRPTDDHGHAVDPALTQAIDEIGAEHVRFKGYP